MIYEASELAHQGRTILDAARNGEAHLRDQDGFGLVMLPEARLSALTAIAHAAASLAALEHALTRQTALPLDAASYGDWPWLHAFDADDLQEFLTEMREAVMVSGREEAVGALADTLDRWRITAEALEDPLRRQVLLGIHTDDDFVEVARPQ